MAGTDDDAPQVRPEEQEKDEALEVEVVPQQSDEFTCMGCFLVRHQSQLAAGSQNHCLDCA